MPSPIELVFDFSSPYGYLAVMDAPRLAKQMGREVHLRPYLMGAAMKQTGAKPLPEVPLKGPYAVMDLARSAERLGVGMQLPDPFPFPAILLSRVFYALEAAGEDAHAFAHAALQRLFDAGESLVKPEPVAAVLSGLGLEAQTWLDAAQEQAMKDKLRATTSALIETRACWGSPHYLLDGQNYWGFDRRHDIVLFHTHST